MSELEAVATHGDDAAELEGARRRILGVVFTLVGLGLVLVYSASAVKAEHAGWELHFLIKQSCWMAIGLGGLACASWIDYRRLRPLWPLMLLASLGVLAGVLVPGLGTNVRGAYRWFRVGGINVQASEVAKLGLVLVVAALLARRPNRDFGFWRGFLPVALLVGVASALIAAEPDFGTAALVAAVLLAMVVAAGARWWHVGLLGLAAGPPAVYYGLTRFSHIGQRLLAWWGGETAGAGWQPYMSKVALGSGGPTGLGLGEGPAKWYYLPDAHTDFIFAIAGQELGLLGTLAIVALFSVFVSEGLRVVRHAPDRFGALVGFGIVTLIGLQAAFNIAVVTGVVPPKGISLPFVSFGGSGLCMSLTGVGLLVSITRQRRAAEAAVAAASGAEILTWRERVVRGEVPGLRARTARGEEAA